jgi:hypothetical protein
VADSYRTADTTSGGYNELIIATAECISDEIRALASPAEKRDEVCRWRLGTGGPRGIGVSGCGWLSQEPNKKDICQFCGKKIEAAA